MRIGILTSGGDCQCLNATIRGIAKALYNQEEEVQIYGILDGYKGLIYGRYREMQPEDFSGILSIGGTILGTSREPFKKIREPGEGGIDKVEAMKANYSKWQLDCLVILGGNGTHKTAGLLKEEGLNIITLPKTIDNDIWGTDITFGFHSALDIATRTIDCIHTTAASHNRVFIIEIMGHKVGWLALYAGIAGGADVILIPEIPYNVEKVIETIRHREEKGKKHTIVVVAEGAISQEDAKLTKEEYKKAVKKRGIPSVAYEIGNEIDKQMKGEVRIAVPGHTQRGGSPTAYDRVIATKLGSAAARLIANREYGYMVAIKNETVTRVPVEEVAGKLKKIDPDSNMIKDAKETDICFGI